MMIKLSMDKFERAALWRQRLFEAESGMTNYLLRIHANTFLDEWMCIRCKIFSGLAEIKPSNEDSWKQAFFRSQALLEKFIIGSFGEEAMTDWSLASSEIYALIDNDEVSNPLSPINRIARQAELYG